MKTIDFRELYWKNKAVFSTMAKPVGNRCNLNCEYCYYLDKDRLYNSTATRTMNYDTLEKYIKKSIDQCDAPTISFCWHGGEPLLAGIDFYKRCVELQKKYYDGREIENSLQTNGTLIDQKWADFFAKEKFLIGISIDGPKYIHDANRPGSFERTLRGLELLKKSSVEFNTLSALSYRSSGKGKETYLFLKEIGSHYMQFLPVVEHVKKVEGNSRPVICDPEDENGTVATWSISPSDYGNFLIDVFDQWIKDNDIGKYFVLTFDATLSRMCGVKAGICSMNDQCGDCLLVEHDGTVYSCDHFVYDDYKLGNIHSEKLNEMYQSNLQKKFREMKSAQLPLKCKRCRWHSICYGECPKHRFSTDGYVNYLCTGLLHFFIHTEPFFSKLRDEIVSSNFQN